jgi:hypothetical protein
MSDDLDYYDERLKNHVVQEMPIRNKETFDVLKKRYPNKDSLKLYRGINFRTEEQYLNFMKSIEENKGYKARSADSFSVDERTVLDFALTQPTYFLNEELMIAEDEKRKNKERLSGYCGVVVEIDVPPNTVVDVTSSGLGVEEEAIVEPSSVYPCKVTLVESYKMMLENENFLINEYIKKDFNNDFNDPLFQYILHHHKDKFNNESRQKLFDVLNSFSFEDHIKNLDEDDKLVFESDDLIVVEIEEFVGSIRSNETEKRYQPLFNRRIFEQADAGYFLDESYEMLSEKADRIMEDFTNFSINNNGIKWRENNDLVKDVSKFCSEGVLKYYRDNVLYNKAREYKELGKEGEKINELSGEEFTKALDEHKNKLMNFLNNLISEMPEDSEPKNKNNNRPR